MIFKENHIEQIKAGEKTQTRRLSDRYDVGKTYCIQTHYGGPGDSAARIRILEKRLEHPPFLISEADAKAEGGYTPEDYEELWVMMYGGTRNMRHRSPKARRPRVAYTFEVVHTRP